MTHSTKLLRRSFLKAAGLGAAAVVLSSRGLPKLDWLTRRSTVWFGLPNPWAGRPAFGTYPVQSAPYWPPAGDKGGSTILSGRTFRAVPQGQNVIVIDGVVNAVLADLDFDEVPICIYVAPGVQTLTLRRIRVRNITGPFLRTLTHSGNFTQASSAIGLTIEDFKVQQPHAIPAGYTTSWGTEDIISIGGTCSNVLIQRGMIDGGFWQSWSGTGVFLGDGDQAGAVTVRDVTLLNPGQCAIGTGAGGPYALERVTIYQAQRPSFVSSQVDSTGAHPTVAANGPLQNRSTRTTATGVRSLYHRADGSTAGPTGLAFSGSGNNWADTSVDPAKLAVVL